MRETTVAQEKLFLWLLAAGLSPGPGATGLESDEQGHCLKTGVCCRAAPQGLGRGGRGGSLSSLALGSTEANKPFFNEVLFCPSVRPRWAKQGGPTVRPGDTRGISGAPGSEKRGWQVR